MAEEVVEVEVVEDAEVNVAKMITGDYRATALAIGRQIGIVGDDPVGRVNVFARVAPEHKMSSRSSVAKERSGCGDDW